MKIIFAVVLSLFPVFSHAAMYQWIDENGNLNVTNTAPPAGARIIGSGSESVEHPEMRRQRLEFKNFEREVAAEEERYRREDELQRQRMEIERGRVARETTAYEEARGRQVAVKELIKKERERIEREEEAELDGCRNSGGKYKQRDDCVKSVKRSYKERFARFEADPESYVRRKNSGSGSKHSGRTAFVQDDIDNGGHPEEPKPPQTIITTKGEILNRAAGGYTGQDGTIYTDAAGGIINTRTGRFSPVP